MLIYNVTGKANAGELLCETEDFSLNVCAACKRDAYHYAAETMRERGYQTVIPVAAVSLGAPGVKSSWFPGMTLRIS